MTVLNGTTCDYNMLMGQKPIFSTCWFHEITIHMWATSYELAHIFQHVSNILLSMNCTRHSWSRCPRRASGWQLCCDLAIYLQYCNKIAPPWLWTPLLRPSCDIGWTLCFDPKDLINITLEIAHPLDSMFSHSSDGATMFVVLACLGL